MATPTYRVRKELQNKISSPSQVVDPADVTVLGEVESKGDSSDRGETPSKNAKKSSHKSPSKKKPWKSSDFHAELKSMDDKWAERFSRLEAMFLAKSFTVPVEPVQKSVVTVTERPFIPPVQQPTGFTGQKQPTRETQIATQPIEAPGAVDVSGPVIATQPVEAPGAVEMTQTGQDASFHPAADRPEVQPQVLSARCLPVVDQSSSPQIPLACLLLSPEDVPLSLPVLQSLLKIWYRKVDMLVTGPPTKLMKGRSLT